MSSAPYAVPRPKAVVCDIELLYASYGDVVDPEDHRKLCNAAKCVLGRVLEWCEGAAEFLGWGR